jgi:cephalosporin hydroxylase
MTPRDAFRAEREAAVARQGSDKAFAALSREWFDRSAAHRYSYNFEWMGVPIIQYPQDILAMQELIWRVQPEVIVETGVAHGGSLIFYASMLSLLGRGEVVGVELALRPHNREAILAHPMARAITLVDGSSTDPAIVARVAEIVAERTAMVVLDSNHTHAHVLGELRAYAPFVQAGSYLVVMDTVIEQMPADFFPDRPWSRGDNAATAVAAFLAENDRFEVDRAIDAKLMISVAPGGYLRRRG